MNDLFYIIWAAGVLALAGGALYGYQMNWRKGLVYALIWACLFALVTLFINAVNV